MKKSINLYHPNCQPIKTIFRFSQFIMLFIFCLSVSVLTFILMTTKTYQYELQTENAQRELSQVKDKVAMLISTKKQSHVSIEKKQYKARLMENIRETKSLIANLSDVEFKKEVNFPDLMSGLMAVQVNDLTLDSFTVLDGRLSIYGRAKYSDAITQWLKQMNNISALKSITFNRINIEQKPQGFYFQLSSKASTLGGKQ